MHKQLISKAPGLAFGGHVDETLPLNASVWSEHSLREISEFQVSLKDASFQVLVHLIDLMAVLLDALLQRLDMVLVRCCLGVGTMLFQFSLEMAQLSYSVLVVLQFLLKRFQFRGREVSLLRELPQSLDFVLSEAALALPGIFGAAAELAVRVEQGFVALLLQVAREETVLPLLLAQHVQLHVVAQILSILVLCGIELVDLVLMVLEFFFECKQLLITEACLLDFHPELVELLVSEHVAFLTSYIRVLRWFILMVLELIRQVELVHDRFELASKFSFLEAIFVQIGRAHV